LRSLKFFSKSERKKIDLNASRQIFTYLVSLDSQNESAEIIGKRFISLAGRDSDSEYLLLSYASHMISNRYWSDSVVLRIMSERPPCKSCSSAIIQFLARHAEAKLELYFIELPGDWNDLPACGRLKVTWVVNFFSLTGSMVWV
jgi:hypothetical protein